MLPGFPLSASLHRLTAELTAQATDESANGARLS